MLAEGTASSLLAGAIAGSLGVGASYPLDSIKTKSQALASSRLKGEKSPGMVTMFQLVYQKEGVNGFYQGVIAVMIGQAFIKSTLFAANAFALTLLVGNSGESNSASVLQLCLAGCFSGFVGSFVINPIERVKVLMQADTGQVKRFTSSIDCGLKVVQEDGIDGLVGRGLDATLWREVPGCALYFFVYAFLKQLSSDSPIESFAPLLCGAAAGMIAWIPVYPFDVVKTSLQNKQGNDGEKEGLVDMAIYLYNTQGIGVFYDGINPKLLRAAINHGVTFYVYDFIINLLDKAGYATLASQ